MTFYQGRFLIARDGDAEIWAEPAESGIAVKRGRPSRLEDAQTLFTLLPDQTLRLAAWAQPSMVVVPFTGLLARQIKDLARDVDLSPQNFVVEAVNAFIQAGEMASGGHGGHGRPQGGAPVQEIRFESRRPGGDA